MDRSEVAEMARDWWAAVGDASFVPMSPSDIQQLMTVWITDLETAMTAEPFDPAPVRQVGADMVHANLTVPAAMMPSSTVLAGLLERSARPDRARRFGALLGKLGHGYITELLATQARNQEAAERFRVMFDNAAVAIARYDVDGITIDANIAAARMVGIDRKDLPGVAGLDFVHPDDREKLRTVVVGLFRRGHGTVHFEGRFQRRDGRICWGAWTMTLMHGNAQREKYLLAVGEDTTERHVMQAKLRWQATHDPLTGLLNRRSLLDQLETIVAESGPTDQIGLCFVDLDAFKLVNDQYGHGAGDRILSEVGRKLGAALASPSVTLARIGGDEFVALLAPPCDDDAVAAAAETMLATLQEPVQIGRNQLLSMSASIGAVVTAVAGAKAEKLLDEADIGLYRAKTEGRGTWVLHRTDDGHGRSP
ncbi:diguanylate cyclase (GGDEF)-like protein/PAS domain S-box-containing protein [Nocardia sp. GAS34]|uniref:diguanylate cyclase domain-containing protein n=1 Tax=unclassified Nocardia TaxID=2637762 RepID=UPI003D1EDB2F